MFGTQKQLHPLNYQRLNSFKPPNRQQVYLIYLTNHLESPRNLQYTTDYPLYKFSFDNLQHKHNNQLVIRQREPNFKQKS